MSIIMYFECVDHKSTVHQRWLSKWRKVNIQRFLPSLNAVKHMQEKMMWSNQWLWNISEVSIFYPGYEFRIHLCKLLHCFYLDCSCFHLSLESRDSDYFESHLSENLRSRWNQKFHTRWHFREIFLVRNYRSRHIMTESDVYHVT